MGPAFGTSSGEPACWVLSGKTTPLCRPAHGLSPEKRETPFRLAYSGSHPGKGGAEHEHVEMLIISSLPKVAASRGARVHLSNETILENEPG